MNFSSKLLGVTCASVIALGVGSVNATDMYRSSGGGLKDAPTPYVVAPLPIWTGFYAGINGGGSFGASENLRVRNNVDPTEADIGQFFRDGGFGGGQIGYNWSGSDGATRLFSALRRTFRAPTSAAASTGTTSTTLASHRHFSMRARTSTFSGPSAVASAMPLVAL